MPQRSNIKKNEDLDVDEDVGPLYAIGIDIGSMYVRVAYIKNDGGGVTSNDGPQLMTNEMGQRSTLSVVAKEKEEDASAETYHYTFGEAAYKYLLRKHPKKNILKEFNLQSLLLLQNDEEDGDADSVQAFLRHVITCTIHAMGCRAIQLRMVLSIDASSTEEESTKWQQMVQAAWIDCCDKECPITHKKKKKQWMQQYVHPVQAVLAVCNSASATLAYMEHTHSDSRSNNANTEGITVLDWGASGLHKTTVQCSTAINFYSSDDAESNNKFGLYKNPTLTSYCSVSGQELQMVLLQQVISIFCRQSRIPLDELQSNKKKIFQLQMYMPEALRTLARGNVARIDMDEFYEGCDLHIQIAPVRWEMMLQSSSYWKQVKQILSSTSGDVLLVGNVWSMPLACKSMSHCNILNQNNNNSNSNQSNNMLEEIVVQGCAMYADQLLQQQFQSNNNGNEEEKQDATNTVIPPTKKVLLSPVTLGLISKEDKVENCMSLITTDVTPLPAILQYTCQSSSPSSVWNLVQILPSQDQKVLAELSCPSSSTTENDDSFNLEVYLSSQGVLQLSINGGPKVTIGS